MFLPILTIFTLIADSIYCEYPIADTPQGQVQGTHRLSYKGRTYSAFEGIPYAKPPVGELRFKEPHPADKWDETLVANTEYMCLNFFPFPEMWGVRGHEDCLYLYVYVPTKEIDPNDNFDVVVHIHGGAFMMGSPKLYAGPDYIMDEDVIFVTMNYRLGILGFLSTADKVVPGNNGLKDQVLALEWIRDNIEAFGGNPESVTLTGLFSGGSSVHYHYLSPMSRGLFHRGFSQSGTALQHSALVEDALTKARHVAARLNCSTHSSHSMVECMRHKPARKLIMAVTSLFVLIDAIPVTPFGPVIEEHSPNPFLPAHPYQLINERKFYDVPWITSNHQNEGIYPVGLFVLLHKLGELDKHWDKLIPFALDFNETVEASLHHEVSMKMRHHYFHRGHVLQNNVDHLIQLFSDRIFFDTEQAVRLQANRANSSVYYYFFTYQLEEKLFAADMVRGVGHTDDGKLFLRMAHTPNILPKNDEIMMEHFVDFIATYAKTGLPKFGAVEWTPVQPDEDTNIDYIHIGSPKDISMKSIKELAPTEFWNSLPIMENEKLFDY